MIATLSVALLLFADSGALDPAPIAGDCARDPDVLAARAAEVLGTSSESPVQDLARARELLRAARRARRSAELDLRAADLAFAAGDLEEGGDLLASAAEIDPRASLSAGEIALLARRAEERRRWREAIALYDALRRALAAEGEMPPWITPKIRELELEVRAAAIAPPPSMPSVEARLAVADGRRVLARGELGAAREKLLLALRLSPGYADALLALSAVEARAGRPDAAIRAARDALAAEPDRVEAMTALAALLWAEPDRRAKEEALGLFDRAAARRPSEPQLLRAAAERYAELGDAPRALERLDRYLAKASPREREEVAPLRAALARGVRGNAAAAGRDVAAGEPASEAVDRWRKAQVLAESGDFESFAAALDLLAEAERLDPAFAQAPELAAAIHRRRGEPAEAEAALRRAIRADPSRPAPREELARLYDEDPDRRAEAARAWREAADAGSTEAVYELARAAEEAGQSGDALALYRRYRAESPSGLGLHTERAASAIARLEAARTRLWVAAGVLALGLLAAAAVAVYRRKAGQTLEEWLADCPGRVHRARPIVGRLRHETLKHGGLLLPDAGRRLGDEDPAVQRDAAKHISERLYGEGGDRENAAGGLVAEARNAMRELSALAREDGARLNLERRDPAFSQIARGLRALDRARPSLARAARSDASRRPAERAAKLLSEAARRFGLASGTGIDRVLDRASALPVRVEALEELLARVAMEAGVPAPKLERLGAVRDGEGLPSVRFAPLDWETLWRNLFSNALAAGRAPAAGRPGPVRLGLSAEKRRDEATGESRLRLVLADDLPDVSSDELRTRPSERGWGVIAEILRRNDAAFDVVPAPARGFTKGIGLDLSAIEGEGAS